MGAGEGLQAGGGGRTSSDFFLKQPIHVTCITAMKRTERTTSNCQTSQTLFACIDFPRSLFPQRPAGVTELCSLFPGLCMLPVKRKTRAARETRTPATHHQETHSPVARRSCRYRSRDGECVCVCACVCRGGGRGLSEKQQQQLFPVAKFT